MYIIRKNMETKPKYLPTWEATLENSAQLLIYENKELYVKYLRDITITLTAIPSIKIVATTHIRSFSSSL